MLLGLLRLRLVSGGAFNMGRFLWRQVRWWQFPLAVTNSLMRISVCQGLIWLLIATVVEVPPVVRLAILCTLPFCSSLFHATGVRDFESEW
jgi:hypothetical protein